MAHVTPAAAHRAQAAAPSPKISVAPPANALDASGDADAETLPLPADRAARRAEVLAVARRLKDQDRQSEIDRIHAGFDADAAERAEYQREMNVLRDMAMEQQKHDDEILKKWIALI
jgi:hypothetical protein